MISNKLKWMTMITKKKHKFTKSKEHKTMLISYFDRFASLLYQGNRVEEMSRFQQSTEKCFITSLRKRKRNSGRMIWLLGGFVPGVRSLQRWTNFFFFCKKTLKTSVGHLEISWSRELVVHARNKWIKINIIKCKNTNVKSFQ